MTTISKSLKVWLITLDQCPDVWNPLGKWLFCYDFFDDASLNAIPDEEGIKNLRDFTPVYRVNV